MVNLPKVPDLPPAPPPAGGDGPSSEARTAPLPGDVPRFPAGFLWGAATASYQIEGAVDVDGRGISIWDTFSHTPGNTFHGETGDVACDHYHRYGDDVALMAELGIGAYRFSVAWPRIQPDGRGPANDRGLDFYRRLLDALGERDIAACLTLYHWDLPQALEDRGGWMSRDTAYRFADYAEILGRAFGDRVALWAPVNEAFVHWSEGYGLGIAAPGRALLFGAFPAGHNLLLGHGLAVRALRSAAVRGAIGSVNNLTVVKAATADPADEWAAYVYDLLRNRLFTDPLLGAGYPPELEQAVPGALDFVSPDDLAIIGSKLDFLGVNYYNPEVVRGTPDLPLGFDFVEPEGVERTGFGWPIEPDCFRQTLVELRKRFGAALPPIYVTENGASFPDAPDVAGCVTDVARIRYLDGHLRALRAAIDEGVDVRGYFVWSLVDNFEWAAGYSQRFGLTYVDYPTQRRIPKASFHWYRGLISAQR